ncbi:hypothetical protein EMA8858_01825 [Emticicia aquatica]|uniref:Secreted protein (Por secretion system target) n=1 Tax=Emticicia aquatica TaxID=1681835 RepID=A0ABN8EUQ6_9BACT|nr:metallophosphoesterase [Emticicia aquatica]CAH0995700.1 hypothetical protein EMA8858_01825 [Emticicia aquatica]
MIFQEFRKKIQSTAILFVCLSLPIAKGWVGFLQAQTLIRGPYLQQLGSNSVIIRWRTDLLTNSLVTYNKQDFAEKQTVKDLTLTKEHIVQLTDLEPNTRYSYSVGSDTKTLASGRDFYFITAPTVNNSRPINIWAMGDFGDNSKPVYTKNQTDVRDQYLKNKSSYTDMWLWLGDNAYGVGTDTEYQKLVFDFYGSNILGNTTFFPVPGNHEYLETPTAQIDKKISYFNIINVPTQGELGGIASNTKAYYSYNYGNIHFVALDSYGLEEGKFRLYNTESKQYQWLVHDLESNKSLWTVVFFHHPPYTKRSHDSNAEEELRLIRERLVPVFDKNKVDLVLNGHSHVYERSFLMKGQTGHSATFNPAIHVVQNVNGKYEKKGDSRPIINKDEGTIYAVVGSAGRLDWNGDPEPHPTSVYSNYTIGGSLLMTFNDNRLDARWVCADGEIRDNFTVFKNVNKTEKKSIEYGEKIRLNASWKGSHQWSIGVKNQEFIEISPRKDTIISVVDSLGFLKDIFQITVSPKPIITTEFLSSEPICLKKSLKVYFNVKNTPTGKWNYQLELSDENGSFDKATVVAKASKSPFEITLADTLKESPNYRFRIRPNVDFFEEIPSQKFSVFLPATATFLGETIIPFDTIITLKLGFEGSLPFTYKISSFTEGTAQSKELVLKVKQLASANYVLENVSNICGNGTVLSNNKISILAPLAIEGEENQAVSIFPNPTFGEITIENHTNKQIKGLLILRDINGKKLSQKSISINQQEQFSLEEYAAGTYILTLKTSKLRINQKIIKY